MLLMTLLYHSMIRDAFKSMERARPDALIVQQTATFDAYIKEIAELALDSRLPSIHESRPIWSLRSKPLRFLMCERRNTAATGGAFLLGERLGHVWTFG